jgi:ATP-dependent Clp protease ATP-binding subunit ClpC
MQPAPQSSLFLPDGDLDLGLFDDRGRLLLEGCLRALRAMDRPSFLPVDLLLVMVQAGDEGTQRSLARAIRGTDDAEDLLASLELLARRVERKSSGQPRLHIQQLSLGFVGILEDARNWALEAGRTKIGHDDISRALKWRIELQESASVRWAIKQLAQPGGDYLFSADGSLRYAAFTSEFAKIFQSATELACQAGIAFVGTPQLMAALCATRVGLLVKSCSAAGLDPKRLSEELLRIVGTRLPQPPHFLLTRRSLTPRLVRMLAGAADLAERRGHPIGEAELLEAFLSDGGSSLDMVKSLGLEPHLRAAIGDGRVMTREVSNPLSSATVKDRPDDFPASDTPTLDLVGRDLSAEAAAGRLPKVQGRDHELQRIINVLLRSEQRNPLLTGEAGVGKTALAAALAQRIHDGSVPAALLNLRVIELNGASLIGGTSYRGELEARIKALLSEAEQDVILFIDEAHAVFAPRSGAGQPAEVPNHFKAALASGKIAVVAATTEMEYHRWIEQDPALRRRFERIEIPELSAGVSRDILRQLAPTFERTYQVPVSPDAVDAAIELSTRFIPEQSLPDKAKKLLMDATIAVASEIAAASGSQPSTRDSDEEVTLHTGILGRHGDTPMKRVVTRLDVARQVSQKTGVPFERISRAAAQWWTGVEERLGSYLVGQGEAVRKTARYLVAGRLRAASRNRPQAVMLFAGPAGVGKTDLARGLAIEVFGSTKSLIRIELGDYAEVHSLSRLVGSPPGYVGYQDEDALVSPLRRRPSSVVLLKDFHLAHPRVQDRLIRLMSDGEISDTRGLRADASHAIFVMTVETELKSGSNIGFGSSREGEVGTLLRAIDPTLATRLRPLSFETVTFRGADEADSTLMSELFEARLTAFEAAVRDEYGEPLGLDEELLEQVRASVATLRDARELEAFFGREIVDRVTSRLLDAAEAPKVAFPSEEAIISRIITPAE